MTLVKTQEDVSRRFDGDKATEEVTNTGYQVKNNHGDVVGYANAYAGGLSLNMTTPGATIAGTTALIEKMFGAVVDMDLAETEGLA
jgi:hypothetical protein